MKLCQEEWKITEIQAPGEMQKGTFSGAHITPRKVFFSFSFFFHLCQIPSGKKNIDTQHITHNVVNHFGKNMSEDSVLMHVNEEL